MKKVFGGLLPLLLFLTGCETAKEKTVNLSLIYGVTAIISLLLLVMGLIVMRERKRWFILLFSSVFVVNAGYTLLSVSPDLETALWANRLSYLGSVFLPFAMLMIIFSITNTKPKRWVPLSLFCLAIIIFLIAASPGFLDIYYKEVSFAVVNGVSTLEKTYGPLHPIYLVYLLGYFTSMVIVIINAYVKKRIDTTANAVFIAIAVFVNIGVWFIEQMTSLDFEFLSVSYIISELFLVGVHLVMLDNQRLRLLVIEKENELQASVDDSPSTVSEESMEYFVFGLKSLTAQERQIYEYYVSGASTKEILSALNIKENTLKFHNKNLYGKLGVPSRKQLITIYKAIKADMKKNGNNAKYVI